MKDLYTGYAAHFEINPYAEDLATLLDRNLLSQEIMNSLDQKALEEAFRIAKARQDKEKSG